jgi:hypothetical protein
VLVFKEVFYSVQVVIRFPKQKYLCFFAILQVSQQEQV